MFILRRMSPNGEQVENTLIGEKFTLIRENAANNRNFYEHYQKFWNKYPENGNQTFAFIIGEKISAPLHSIPLMRGDWYYVMTGTGDTFETIKPPANEITYVVSSPNLSDSTVSGCPKVKEIVEALTELGPKNTYDKKDCSLWDTNINIYANSMKVVLAYQTPECDEIEFSGFRAFDHDKVSNLISNEGNNCDTCIPHRKFNIYDKQGQVEAVGVAFHIDDAKNFIKS